MNEKEKQERHETVKEELRDLKEELNNSDLDEEEWKKLDRKEDKLISEDIRLSLGLD